MAAPLKVTIIGAGRVATHLGKRLFEQGIQIQEVFSRQKPKAQRLAEELHAQALDELSNVQSSADLYLLAISDNAISEVAQALSFLPQSAIIVHTSGATPSTVLQPYFERFGIFYPLQSFSEGRQPDFTNLPICIHATLPEVLQTLEILARLISPKVYHLNDQDRAILHVAAVFVNNFSNHLFHIAEQMLEQEDLPFELLKPLILETAQKVQQQSPSQMQTGPASREDDLTLLRHLDYLSKFPEWQKLYENITKSIYPKFGDTK